MKRVLQIVGSINAGGMETMIMNYYRNIDRSKIQFDFLIFTEGKGFYEDEITKLGGKIFKLTSRRKNPIKNYIELRNFFKNNKYDVVQIHQGVTTLLPLKMASKYGVKKIIVHNHGINRKIKKVLAPYIEIYVKPKIEKLATDFFACSENVLDHIYTKNIIKNKKYYICPNAVDVEKFKFNEEIRNRKRKDLNVQNNVVYGHVGTFTEPKNHKFLIDIFEELYKKDKTSKLLLIGKGPMQDEIKKNVIEKGLENAVKFLGQREDVNELMMAMDMFLFPSLYEGLPVTLVEAQYAQIKILASKTITQEVKISKNIEFIELNKDKWLQEINNVDNKIYLVENNKFDIKETVKDLEKIYMNGEKK